MRLVTGGLRLCITCISPDTPGSDGSGCATRSMCGRLECRIPELRDVMSAESVGVYEEIYISEKYCFPLPADGIGPMACTGRYPNTDVGHHQTRDCSGIPNSLSLLITGRPISS